MVLYYSKENKKDGNMDIELKSKIDFFNDSYKDMKKTFFLDGRKLNVIKALLSITDSKNFDSDKIKEVRKYIFSCKFDLFNLRYGRFISIFICDSKDYKRLFKLCRDIYEHLTAIGFSKNKKTVVISLLVSKNFEEDKLHEMVARLVEIREKSHVIDYLYYILIAILHKDISKAGSELIKLKNKIGDVESYKEKISFLLALSIIIGDEDINTKVENAFSLLCNIKGEMGKIPEESIVFIGMASLIIEDPELFSKELKSIYDSLNYKKIAGIRNSKFSIALCILIGRYLEEAKSGVLESRVNNDYLKIIHDYVIYLTYFN